MQARWAQNTRSLKQTSAFHAPCPATAAFYSTTSDTAAAIYDALWQPNGLASGLCFNTSQLAGTEAIYAWDTQQGVPADRTWVQDIFC